MALDKNRKLKILISNDDGVSAPGLEALVKVLCSSYEVVVSAPATQQSAMSQALTVRNPLYVDEYKPLMDKYGIKALGVGGTPSDSVKLYMEGWPDRIQPDVVISGMNHGPNLGTDVHYSGTVGAALEGFIHRTNAISVSRDYKCELSYDECAELLAAKLPELLAVSDEPVFLNINFPRKLKPDYKWVWTHQGIRDYKNAYIPRKDEDGRIYYIVGGEPVDDIHSTDSDVVQYATGNIPVTPILIDKTNYTFLNKKLGKSI